MRNYSTRLATGMTELLHSNCYISSLNCLTEVAVMIKLDITWCRFHSCPLSVFQFGKKFNLQNFLCFVSNLHAGIESFLWDRWWNRKFLIESVPFVSYHCHAIAALCHTPSTAWFWWLLSTIFWASSWRSLLKLACYFYILFIGGCVFHVCPLIWRVSKSKKFLQLSLILPVLAHLPTSFSAKSTLCYILWLSIMTQLSCSASSTSRNINVWLAFETAISNNRADNFKDAYIIRLGLMRQVKSDDIPSRPHLALECVSYFIFIL